MYTACLLLSLTSALMAGAGTVLPATRQAHVLTLQKVYLNGAGPFRMIIDTANASSVVCPSVAKRLRLTPSGEVELVTPSGSRRAPLSVLSEVRAGAVADEAVEVMIAEPGFPGVDGILGQSFLVRHDYLVDYYGCRLVLDGPVPEGGIKLPLRSGDGMPEVVAEVDGQRRALLVDSGAPALVLFGVSPMLPTYFVETNAGRSLAGAVTARVSLGGRDMRRMAAVQMRTERSQPALLPVCEFAAVYISNREGFVIFLSRGR